jgi:DNA-binding MarR family transcriptional regulator
VNIQKDKNIKLQLKLINEIEKRKSISQRIISKELGVALGLANALIKSFIKKGFLKLSQAPIKRYAYYLTPKGLTEKSRLTAQYLKNSLEFFKTSRNEFEQEFLKIKELGYSNLILVGIGELAEIAIMASHSINLQIDAILDSKTRVKQFYGIKVYKKIKSLEFKGAKNVFVITDMIDHQKCFDFLKKEKVFKIISPKMLMISEK